MLRMFCNRRYYVISRSSISSWYHHHITNIIIVVVVVIFIVVDIVIAIDIVIVIVIVIVSHHACQAWILTCRCPGEAVSTCTFSLITSSKCSQLAPCLWRRVQSQRYLLDWKGRPPLRLNAITTTGVWEHVCFPSIYRTCQGICKHRYVWFG